MRSDKEEMTSAITGKSHIYKLEQAFLQERFTSLSAQKKPKARHFTAPNLWDQSHNTMMVAVISYGHIKTEDDRISFPTKKKI